MGEIVPPRLVVNALHAAAHARHVLAEPLLDVPSVETGVSERIEEIDLRPLVAVVKGQDMTDGGRVLAVLLDAIVSQLGQPLHRAYRAVIVQRSNAAE